jgi:transcriptional regulator with XRE-family HTH domain
MNLGQIIKKLRQQKGLKQNMFADLCNLSPAYLSQIENNQKDPNLSILKDIIVELH